MDSLATIFIILSFVGAGLGVVGIVLSIKSRSALKFAAVFFMVLAVMLCIGTLVNGIIGGPKVYYYSDGDVRHHPCTWVALGLGCGALLNGVLAVVSGVLAANKKVPQQEQGQGYSGDSNEPWLQVYRKYETENKEVVLVTASSNVGVGLWTSICMWCASIFGVESTNLTKKMERASAEVKRKLVEQMNALPGYDFIDFRIVKEGNIGYSGSVIGIKKK